MRKFLEVYEASHGETVRAEALRILTALKSLVTVALYGGEGGFLIQQLASYFDGDALRALPALNCLTPAS